MNITPLKMLQIESDLRFGLIVLNVPLDPVDDFLHILWQKAILKCCTNGGTDRLFNATISRHEQFIPDFISGDFDSVKQETLQFYKLKGSEIIHTPDQNQTDFSKALKIMVEKCSQSTCKLDAIIALGAHSGRFDHVLGNIETLFQSLKFTDFPVYLFSEESLSFLLPQGRTILNVNTGQEGKYCGLVPIGSGCVVTTSGLVWNLNNQLLQFGTLVSTCNKFDGSGKVIIDTDKPLLWTMSIQKPKNPNIVEMKL